MAIVILITFLFALANAKDVLLHGGGTFLNEHFYKVIELAGGIGNARIGIVTAAASTPADNGQWYVDEFMLRGAEEGYWIPVHLGDIGANSDPVVVSNVQRMTGFIFGAGDQARIIESFFDPGHVDSPVMAAIREVYNNGAVVAGTSAGMAAIVSAPMIMGGMSYEALKFGAYDWNLNPPTDTVLYEPYGGIGVLDGYITDTHYSERGREGRLMRLVSDTRLLSNGVERGIGADEDTALVITDVGTASAVGEVFGPAGVMILDLTGSTVTGGIEWGIEDVYAHYLTHGDRINMNDFTVTPDVWKSNLLGDEYYDNAVHSTDIFDGTRSGTPAEFVRTSRSVFDSRLDTETDGTTKDKHPEFAVHFFQEISSSGFGGYHPDHNEWQITYHNLRVNIVDV